MKFALRIGYPLSFAGLVLYFPPLVQWLRPRYGQIGELGGLILFAIGWALLLAHLAFRLGIDVYRKK
jgi:hypothetical protein